MIACGKVLGEGRMRQKLREQMSLAIPKWVVRVETQLHGLDAHARNYRNLVQACVFNQGESARQHARLSMLFGLLNGDWRSKGHLTHLCNGCCHSKLHTVNKILALLPKTLTTVCRMFCRGNWKGWPGQLAFFLLTAIHGFLGNMLLSVLRSNDHDGDDDDDDDDDDDEAPLQEAARGMEQGDVEALPPPQGEAVQGMGMEAWEIERRETARCRRQAVAFLAETNWLDDLLAVRGGLQPQVDFMKSLLHSTSAEHHARQRCAMASEGVCEYPLQAVIEQKWTKRMFEGCYIQLVSIGEHLPSTALQSHLLKVCFKSAGVAALLIQDKYCAKAMPWRLMSLLKDRSAPACEAILDLPQCCLEEVSLAFLAVYNTVALLQSDEAHHVLAALAGHLSTTASQVERIHSQNLRRRP